MIAFRFKILLIYIFSATVGACLIGSCKTEKPSEAKGQKSVGEVEVVDYYANRGVKMKGKSIDGKRSGLWESFYPSGYRWSEMNYNNGLREGVTTTYFSNGMMRYSGQYYNDERSGVWQFYDSLGVLIHRIDMDEPLQASDSLQLKSLSVN